MLLALLLPDPCDSLCPAEFKEQATEILTAVRQRPGSDEELQKALLWFIGAFANWDMAAHPTYLQVGRNLVRAAHGEEAPLVVDPFAGGGSIPLEALRLGCEAFASDLNPVACLILKVMLEDIPRHGPGLADELRKVGGEIKAAAEKELADLYPADPDGATPIAYLWARTVRCESPNCGAEIPLMRSFWLCKKAARKRALRYQVERPEGETPRVVFEVFEPRADREVPNGSVSRARATCLCCSAVLPPERVRAQLAAERGGADIVFDEEGRRIDGARMTAVVTLRPGMSGRQYRLPTLEDYAVVRRAQDRMAQVLAEWERGGRQGLSPVPDEPLPPIGTLGFRVQRYGMLQWSDLFTVRQKAALVTLSGVCSPGRPFPWCGTLRKRVFLAGKPETIQQRWARWLAWSIRSRRFWGRAKSKPPTPPATLSPTKSPGCGLAIRPTTTPFPTQISPTSSSSGSCAHCPTSLCCAIRSIQTTRSRRRQQRRCRMKPSRSTDGLRTAGGSRRRWLPRSRRAVACCVRTALAPSCSRTRLPRAGRRCSRA